MDMKYSEMNRRQLVKDWIRFSNQNAHLMFISYPEECTMIVNAKVK